VPFKRGYLPRDFSKPAPTFESYLTAAHEFGTTDPLPNSPSYVDRESKVSAWPMYKNDTVGDCTVAAVLHMVASFTAFSGSVPGGAMFTDDEAIKIYSAVSGYNPVTGANDNGATLASVCQYMVKIGATDVNGKVHKFAAWAEVGDYTNTSLLKRITNAFGTAYLAIDFPDSAMTQFNDGLPWTYVAGSPNDGGHAIPLQYSAENTGTMDDETIITWGAEWKMNEAFWHHQGVEAVAVVSADDVNVTSGTNPAGLALTQLVSDCQSKYLV
jgi:hypothetical protein